jgi:3-hydroxyisobutyrate dehydrogenase-like beta-hydroxyacid dehydrogenase
VTTVGVLHPGEMGVAISAGARSGGNEVVWSTVERSEATRRRAADARLRPLESLAAVVEVSEVVISVCPPSSAIDVARSVADLRFSGVYVDANAVSPGTAAGIKALVISAGATYVDGGIIGGPAQPRLLLTGGAAAAVAALFSSGRPITAVVLEGGGEFGASAVKMAYAAWSKGTTALLLAVAASAERLGVLAELREEWSRSQPDLGSRLAASHRSAAKAWRWEGEMREIAATLGECGLPEGFHQAAADVFGRLAGFKDSTADLAEMLSLLAPSQDQAGRSAAGNRERLGRSASGE